MCVDVMNGHQQQYSAIDGAMHMVRVSEVASLRSGMSSQGKWYTGDDNVTLYDRYGSTYTVKAKDMEETIKKDKLYSQPFVGPLTEKEIKENQKKIQADVAMAFKLMGKTEYKPVKVDGEYYYEALPSDMKIEGLGESTPFVVDMMKDISEGRLSYSEMFDVIKLLCTTANEYVEYKTDNLHFIKNGDYLIVKGARSESALKRGIKGTRYRISDLSPHSNVMQYVKVKPALREAFLSNAGKASLALDVVVGAGFDIYEEYQKGKRGRELAVEIVEEVGSNVAVSIVATAAGAAVSSLSASAIAALSTEIGGTVGTAISPGVGTIIGLIAGMAVGWAMGTAYEKYLEDDFTDFIGAVFEFFGI